MHDGVAQTMLQLNLQIGICHKMLDRGKYEMLRTELLEIEERIGLASRQIREMIADMYPPKADKETVLNQLLKYIIDTHIERGGIPVEYDLQWTDEQTGLSDHHKLALVRIAQEALLNIRKHSEAKTARLILSEDDSNFYMIISDNGLGFDPEAIKNSPLLKGGAGLSNMYARASATGGVLTIARDESNTWMEIKFSLPK